MSFSPDLAAIRFGCGLSPRISPPTDAAAMLTRLRAPDVAARDYPVDDFAAFTATLKEYRAFRKAQRKAIGTSDSDRVDQEFSAFRKQARQRRTSWFAQALLRQAHTDDGFRERLVGFWSDHFTARGKAGLMRMGQSPYIETAIRPHITGSFFDLLVSATTHPLMLHYLDQAGSVGPASRIATRSKKLKGLNENLAREVMELHTLGVDGPYNQTDVRQLAELFTGLTFTLKKGFVFNPRFAEPGAETVLGQSYGGDPARLQPVLQVLRDLALHPATAKHIARKLVVHFVSDQPDPDLVAHIAARYRATDGDLMQVYTAMLEHPAAWQPQLANVKPPMDFLASTCRALAVGEIQLVGNRPQRLQRLLLRPMAMMGQTWEAQNGPDGWAEEDAAWITPQGLAARMRWAMLAPQKLVKQLPDPAAFVATSLGSQADPRVLFAAQSAETQAEAIGLVLSSPAFQRR